MTRSNHLRRLLALIAIVLALQLTATVTSLWLAIDERQESRERREETVKALKELETERQKVFKEYAEALDSYETKSVMHQIYHASNAQLRLQNLLAQQQQLFTLRDAEE